MGCTPQESLENTINTVGTLLGYTQLSLDIFSAVKKGAKWFGLEYFLQFTGHFMV